MDEAEERQQHRESLEEKSTTADNLTPMEEEDAKREDVGQINAALKTIQVIGQILRNLPGSLRGEVKLEMTTESYKLGLRTLGVLCRAVGNGIDDLREQIRSDPTKVFGKDLKEFSEDELSQRINKVFFFIVASLGYGIVKNVSQAVGSTQLKETYKEVLENEEGIGISLIDLSVRLDHLRPFPEEELFGLYKSAHGNEFVRTLLRAFALEHMYLYPCKQSLIQKVCDRMDIAVKNSRFFNPGAKIE